MNPPPPPSAPSYLDGGSLNRYIPDGSARHGGRRRRDDEKLNTQEERIT